MTVTRYLDDRYTRELIDHGPRRVTSTTLNFHLSRCGRALMTIDQTRSAMFAAAITYGDRMGETGGKRWFDIIG